MNKRGLTTTALTALALAVPAASAEAAFPGANGEIAYTRALEFAPTSGPWTRRTGPGAT